MWELLTEFNNQLVLVTGVGVGGIVLGFIRYLIKREKCFILLKENAKQQQKDIMEISKDLKEEKIEGRKVHAQMQKDIKTISEDLHYIRGKLNA